MACSTGTVWSGPVFPVCTSMTGCHTGYRTIRWFWRLGFQPTYRFRRYDSS